MVQGGLRTQPSGGSASQLTPESPVGAPSEHPAGLDRLGRAIVRRRWWTLGVWLVVVVLLGAGSAGVGKPFRDVFTIPGTGAQTAADILSQRFPAENQPSAQVVFHSRQGKVAPGLITDVSASIRKLEGVASVGAPQTSPNGQTVIVPVSYSGTFSDIPKDGLTALEGATSVARAAGLEVEYGGQVVDLLNQQSSATDHADEIGLAFALIILLFVFGTVVAALLPVSVAVIGVVVATMVLTLLATRLHDRDGRTDPRDDDRSRRRDRLLAARRQSVPTEPRRRHGRGDRGRARARDGGFGILVRRVLCRGGAVRTVVRANSRTSRCSDSRPRCSSR